LNVLSARLAGYDATIVTAILGSTRDPLKEFVSLDGLPVNLVDTAGLPEFEGPIEVEGIRRSREAVRRTDRLLWVVEVGADCPQCCVAFARLSVRSSASRSFTTRLISLAARPRRSRSAACR
jgi:tRNA U34 5-carboxymethylaminomethyl modifying GTPase MnmE/TrmE